MSKGTRVVVGGWRWLGVAVVRAAAAGLILVGGITAGSGVVPGVATAAQAPPAQGPAADGAFTRDQAADGWSVYGVQCEQCHGPGLEGMVHAPPLIGVDFLNGWAGRTTDELFAYLRDEMPPGQAGALSDRAYIGLVAYMLEANGAVPGERTLMADAGVPIGDAADIEEARRAAGAGERPRRRSTRFVNQVVPHDLSPVTDEMLADPPPGDWLSWRRTRNSHGYSTLDEITRDSVGQLNLAWSISVRQGNHQTTPLVHDGVMFLAHPGNVIQALDAATGDVIWVYRHRLPEDARPGPTRTLALYGDKLFLATSDVNLVALDARTGEEVWKTVKADYTAGLPRERRPGHRQRRPHHRHPTVASATRSRPASSPATTRTPARSCGARRRSRCRGIPTTRRGATRLLICGRGATRGSRAASTRSWASSTSARRRPSRGSPRAAG